MPFKAEIINAVVFDATVSLMLVDSSDEDEGDNIMDKLEEDLLTLNTFRYTVQNSPVPKSVQWVNDVLPTLDDRRFKEILRVSRAQFSIILNLIEDNPVYKCRWSSHQTPIFNQLAVVLYRLGSYGDGATASKMSALFGIGDGGTIERFINRFFKAILSIENEYIKWPDEDESTRIVAETIDELPNCIGYLDGCEIQLAEKPALDHTSYYSRKQNYCVKLQVICDKDLRIRHTLVGFPGSVHDARVFSHSSLVISPTSYFSGSQWIAADSAYKLTTTVMTPFRANSSFRTGQERRMFNKYFSSYRVRIEHCFGILKKKFASLKELRIRIKDKLSHKAVCNWIRVCCILHNILLPFLEADDDVIIETDCPTLDEIGVGVDDREGNEKREELFVTLFG